MIREYNDLKVLRLIVSEQDYLRAEELAKEAINNCLTRGSTPNYQSNELLNKTYGYVGELLWAKAMDDRGIKGVARLDTSGIGDDGDDWVSECGVKVDVKTNKWSDAPAGWKNWPINQSNADRNPPDVYVLCNYVPLRDIKSLFIVGGITAKDFKERSVMVHKGGDLGRCKARTEQYVIKQYQLTWNFNELCDKLKGGEL